MTALTDQLASKSVELGVAVWRSDKSGAYNGEIARFAAFIESLNEKLNLRKITRKEAMPAIVITQIMSLSTVKDLKNEESLNKRVILITKVINKLDISILQKIFLKELLEAILNFLENKDYDLSTFCDIDSKEIPLYLIKLRDEFLERFNEGARV